MDSVKLVLFLVMLLGWNGCVSGERPAVVNIGAVLTYDSIIGRSAKAAIEVAVADVNADRSVLGGTRLNLIMENSNCSALFGTLGALKVLEKEAVAIIGPQSSTVAHMISYFANGLQIPLVSFAATDPTLSSLQSPLFLRMAQSDSYQMAAMADFIDFYGWRQVIAIYVDDDYGRNGMYSLNDELAKKMSKIYKFSVPVGNHRDYILNVLEKSKIIGPRVYVIHANPDSGLEIFSVAQQLHMMTAEYVWLATEWFCTAVGTFESIKHSSLGYLQGVVSFCPYIPHSSQLNAFRSKWDDLHRKGVVKSELNAYGIYAYDSVWAVSHAINDFLHESENITFISNEKLASEKENFLLNKLKTFDGGLLLFKKLFLLNFTGLSGQIQFDSLRNLRSDTYEVINVVGPMIQKVGYWTSQFGLSIALPNVSYANTLRNLSVDQLLDNIYWPSGRTETPRGWVAATNEKPLRIVIPYRVSYVEFVTASDDSHTAQGYCIDVFKAAIKLVPYDVPYQFVPFGDGRSNPSYYDLVEKVAEKVVDAAVGDIAIVADRNKDVDFTQPYISTGLVIVVPSESIKSNAWVFLRPFSPGMWCMIGAFFLLIGVVIWLLEHRVNNSFRGRPMRQCVTIFLFSFSTLFNSQQEETMSTLSKFVMMIWLFLLMVITSSYTASLTSFLTVQQLASPINGIDSLIASNEPIGHQTGSFARSYMIYSLNIHHSRLVALGSPEDYTAALHRGPKNGGVAAIVDELPYVELFLQKESGFRTVGPAFTRSGWGFAFPRDSPLAPDMSSAILKLSENGELQRIHKKWFCSTSCSTQIAKDSKPDELHFSSFWGLFLVCGVATTAAFLLFLLRAIYQFIHFKRTHRDSAEISRSGCSHVIYSFFDFIDEKEESIKNMFKQENNSPQSQHA